MVAGNNTIDIEDLPAPAREALVHAIKHRQYAMSDLRSSYYWLVFIAGIALAGYAIFDGYGNVGEAVQSSGSLALYALGFGGMAWGILLHVQRRQLTKLLGFAPGIYVLGSRFIDAKERQLKVYALLDSKPHIIDHYHNGGYQKTTINWHGTTFSYGNKEAASAAFSTIDETLGRLSEAAQANDIAQLLYLDPLTVGMAMAADQPRQRRATPKPIVAMAILFGGAAALTPGVWFLRNHLSLEAAFSRIYSAYQVDEWVSQGGDPERGRIKKMKLEFDDALSYYNKEKADKLREVLEKYPEAPADMKAPAQAALKARYEKTRKDALALSKSEQVTWFINQVYDRLEKGGSVAAMQIKLSRTDNSQLAALDEIIQSKPKLRDQIVPVAKYFEKDDETRNTRLKTAIESGLQQFFPSDVMKFDATAKDSPEIEVFYVIRPKFRPDGTPSLYTEMDRAGNPLPNAMSYPGIQFELGATLKVPGGPQPQVVRFNATPAPTISVSDTADHSAIYYAMAESAFSDLQNKLVKALGGQGDPTIDDDPGSLEGLDAIDEPPPKAPPKKKKR